jgi:hypothetical protein
MQQQQQQRRPQQQQRPPQHKSPGGGQHSFDSVTPPPSTEEKKEEEGPSPLDSFSNMSGGFGGGFCGVGISQVGYGCMGNKLPVSNVDFKE